MPAILTGNRFLKLGLTVAGFEGERLDVPTVQNLRRFKSWYGSCPNTLASIYEDLLTTTVQAARVEDKMADPERFLMSHCFLKNYMTEHVMAGIFKICETTVRTWCSYYIKKVQALKELVVS
jgi:hypothetical protein